MKPQFISNYQGESDFTFRGERYHVRHFALDYEHYNGDVYEREVLPSVGTVRKFIANEFPTSEIMAHFPGYVPARYNPDSRQIETASAAHTQPYQFGSRVGLIATSAVERLDNR